MNKKKKTNLICRLTASILTVLMLFGTMAILPKNDEVALLSEITAEAAASDHTADDAINWVKSKVGTAIDVDGMPSFNPYQCVDLIDAYMEYLGVNWRSHTVTVAADFTFKSCPAGWTRIQGATPQKGDVIVYTGGDYLDGYGYCGHVAIYENESSYYQQNVLGSTGVVHSTGNATASTYVNYWGVLRPNFKNCSLSVEVGNSSVETKFSWNSVANADHYNLRIWKNKLWEGDDYFTDWDLTTTSDSILLLEGTYSAYVDICFPDNSVQMSNSIEFTVKKGTKLDISVGNTSAETEFSWNEVNGAHNYNLRIWKNKLWEGDDYFTDWDLTTTSDSFVLEEGTYFAYVDTVFPDGSVQMSNVVEFTINKGAKLEVSAGNSVAERIFKWNKLDGDDHYNLRIWKDELWNGDDYLTNWDLTTTSDSVVLEEGTYFAYVDTIFPDGTVKMSNVVKIVIPKTIKGDCNSDGKFTISDAVMLQKWLLAVPDAKLIDWKAADLCEDGVINVFDLCMMKRLLISQK